MSKGFGPGTRVRIIGYGSKAWIYKKEWENIRANFPALPEKPSHLLSESNDIYVYDMTPEMVGKIRTINGFDNGQYKLKSEEPHDKVAWYNPEQLEEVTEEAEAATGSKDKAPCTNNTQPDR